jgi:hypothetical protein
MQLDFAMVALGFQKKRAEAKGGSSAKQGQLTGSQSMIETIMDDGMVKTDLFISVFTCRLL